MLQTSRRPASAPPQPVPSRPRLARERSDRLLFARRAAGDPHARAQIIERFLPLARAVARRYERPSEPLDDLVQVASLALVKAVDRFDASRGHAFTSYAVPTISGELKRYFRDRTWSVRPPRDLQELIMRVDRAGTRLAQELDRPPTVAEIAAATDSSDEDVLEALQAREARGGLSLQAHAGAGDERAALEDTLGDDDDGYDRVEDRAVVDSLLAFLPRREREILRLRFEQDLTQSEIGAVFGISQMQVSRIVRSTLAQLRGIAELQEQLADERIGAAA